MPLIHGDAKPSVPIKIEICEEPKRPLQLGDLFTYRFFLDSAPFLVSFGLHLVFLIAISWLVLQVGIGLSTIQLTLAQDPDVDFQESVYVLDLGEPEYGSLELVPTETNLSAEIRQLGSMNAEPDSNESPISGPTFFGTQLNEASIVFVLDCSGSMAQSIGSYRWKRVNRLSIAKRELWQAVKQLQPDQTFYVIGFSNDTNPSFGKLDSPQLVAPTEDNLNRLKHWLNELSPDGGTYPIDSLNLAFKMQPSSIVMLSDGEFEYRNGDADLGEFVAKQNRGSYIHTIAFDDPAAESNLLELSKVSRGEHRFVRFADYAQENIESFQPLDRLDLVYQLHLNGELNWETTRNLVREFVLPELLNPEREVAKTAADLIHHLTYGCFKEIIKPINEQAMKPETQDQMHRSWNFVFDKLDEVQPFGTVDHVRYRSALICRTVLELGDAGRNWPGEQGDVRDRLLYCESLLARHSERPMKNSEFEDFKMQLSVLAGRQKFDLSSEQWDNYSYFERPSRMWEKLSRRRRAAARKLRKTLLESQDVDARKSAWDKLQQFPETKYFRDALADFGEKAGRHEAN